MMYKIFKNIPYLRQFVIERDLLLQQMEVILQERDVLLQEKELFLRDKEVLTREREHKKGFADIFLSPWTDAWKTFYIHNVNNIQGYLEDLKDGMDEKSREVVDTLWEKIIFLIPYNKYKKAFLYKTEEFFTKQELEQQNEHVIPGKYKFPEGVTLEGSIFFTYNGLTFLPQNITLQIANKAIIDGGAYVGDSALVFCEYNPAKIYSFEPV